MPDSLKSISQPTYVIGTRTHAPPHTMTFEALKLRLIFAKLIAYLKVISMCKSSFKAQSNFLIILNFIKHNFGNVHARL